MEVPGIVNQQRPTALSAHWASCVHGVSVEQLATQGYDFLICPNIALPIADDSIDLVITNSVPIDRVMFGEPSIQSSEIRRVLATSGQWVHDGTIRYTKP